MPGTVTVFASLKFANTTGGAASQQLPTASFSVAGDHYQSSIMSVPTTAGGTAIPLGGVSSPGGWWWFQNNDPTNYVDILTAVSGTAFLRLMPGEGFPVRLNPGLTAPAALAHTAAVELMYTALDL